MSSELIVRLPQCLNLLLLDQDERSDGGWGASQSASEIPAGALLISSRLLLRSKQESGRCQAFSGVDHRSALARPLNRYDARVSRTVLGAPRGEVPRGDSTARGHAHSLKMLPSHGCGARHKLRCWPTYFVMKVLGNGLLIVEFLHDRDLTIYVGVHKNSDSLRVQSRL